MLDDPGYRKYTDVIDVLLGDEPCDSAILELNYVLKNLIEEDDIVWIDDYLLDLTFLLDFLEIKADNLSKTGSLTAMCLLHDAIDPTEPIKKNFKNKKNKNK